MSRGEARRAAPPGYVRVGGVTALEEARPWLEALGLTTLEGVFSAPAEPRSDGKALARLPAPDGTTVFVKRYDFSRPALFLRAALKANFPVHSGPAELRNLLALARAGLRVPRPLAAGTEDVGTRRRSFVAMTQLAGQPLDALAPPPAPSARRDLVVTLARLVRALHQAGFWHKDLYLCNVFWDEAQGLGLLDCERVERRAGGPPLRWRVKDLAALDYSATWPTRADRLRFLLAYTGEERCGRRVRGLVELVRRKALRIASRGAKR